MQKNKATKTIYAYAGNHRYLILLGRILAVISAWIAMIPFYDLWKIIKIAIDGEDLSVIKALGLQAVEWTILAMFLYLCALMCTHISAFRVQANMRSNLMRKILTLPLGVFDKEGTGKIRRIVDESTAATETFIAHNIPDKAVAIATPIGLIVLLAVFDWRLGLICIIPLIFAFICMMSVMGNGMQEDMAQYQNALETMSTEAVEYVRGIPVVKTFGQSVHSFRRFKKSIEDYSEWSIGYTKNMRKPMTGYMVCINSVFAFLVAGAYLFSRNGITSELILNIMYYIIITPLLTITMTKIAYSGEQEMVVEDALKRIDSILEMKPLSDSEDNEVPQDMSVTLENVSYRYKDAKEYAVHDLSLEIKSGEHIAFVGESGGGKSTTAQLIARFFDVTEGAIKIGGVNIKDIPYSKLMQMISFVFQDSKLLKTSIFENVRLARPNATEQEVLNTLEQAQCMDIIEKFPDGINTIIGAKGTYLSGGEQQRIAIARAILKNAPILILDEATAFADPDNEEKVQNAIEKLSQGKTMIMIAHRLSIVTNADRIYVLKNGTCYEYGNHAQLMEKNGIYRKMFDEYTKSFLWKAGAKND